jgi:hypothetical protein
MFSMCGVVLNFVGATMTQQNSHGQAIPLAELAFRILILPPIPRGAHLVGPDWHARRLVELWQVTESDVLLADAFRLLDVNAVAGAILRGTVELKHEGDPRYWTFPTLEKLLPELRELAWQRMLAGSLLVEGISIRGKRHRSVLPTELPRLTPDWELSRLTQGGRDEFIEVRIQRAPDEPPAKKTWREKPSNAQVESALADIAKGYPAGAQPAADEVLDKIRKRLGPEVTRSQVRAALKKSVLHGRRGYRSTKT